MWELLEPVAEDPYLKVEIHVNVGVSTSLAIRHTAHTGVHNITLHYIKSFIISIRKKFGNRPTVHYIIVI